MASCGEDSKVKIWDLRRGRAAYSLYGHSGAVKSCVFSFAGDYLATGGDDKNLLIWKSNFSVSGTDEYDIIDTKVK
jgi:centriolar protein POC1